MDQPAQHLATSRVSGNMPGTLLVDSDGPAVTRRVYGRVLPAALVCDHASAAIPAALGNLGLPREHRLRHIAWDIGAARLADRMAQRLRLPLVLSGYSRLVIDCNRRLDDPGSILSVSDAVSIPGNQAMTEADREARASEVFKPYHEAIELELRDCARLAEAPALIAVHSFTECYGGKDRPWHCGVLWDRDPRLAQPMLQALRAEPALVVGDNEPYSGRHPADYTIDVHAERRGWPHLCLEIRQDLLQTEEGIDEWAARLCAALAPLLADEKLYRTADC